MPNPVLLGEFLAQEALARLRAAVDAAADGTPLKGAHIPEERRQEFPQDTLKGMTLHFESEQGQGVSRQVPKFTVTSVLHINGFICQGREDEPDLDKASGELIRAVLDTLLEDASFLKLFGWVSGRNVEKLDVTIAREGTEYDAVVFLIVLELAGGQTTYTPQSGVPFTTATVTTRVGDEDVESRVGLPQPD